MKTADDDTETLEATQLSLELSGSRKLLNSESMYRFYTWGIVFYEIFMEPHGHRPKWPMNGNWNE